MAGRLFELPGIQDLSKEQEAARALPKKGQHLVIGGPGTGKSVLALLRARRHAKAKESHVFLVFNRLLHEASCHLGGSDIHCQQWMSWFFKIFKEITKNEVPRIQIIPGSSWRDIDWETVHDIMRNLEKAPSPKDDYLIIDEGQDMPPDFYKTLAGLGFEHFFVVADQNQQIVAGKNSSRRDIELQLAIEPQMVVELKHNFRNTTAIANLAGEFYTGETSSPKVISPSGTGANLRVPILFTYYDNQFSHMIKRILKLSDREPSKLIGVIAPNNEVRNRFFNALQTLSGRLELDNDSIDIRTYCSENRSEVKFHEGGIMVINAQACKGLEFDHAFLADIDAHRCYREDTVSLKRLFYVMTARARENLTLLRSAKGSSPVDAILPQNFNLLKHYP
ncbi:AAA family ATPase [Desulfobacter latus]|uniref:ATP-binding domain-containing protein n=1 Tax=Desulfobacter latus TaxID=2292 RepID=A0A850T5G9_9BACT|nr:AAA family ATPase [Desulfobacter latus]NWH06341.1 ATP-binding domain-containing protein [Desulfobacter latus]